MSLNLKHLDAYEICDEKSLSDIHSEGAYLVHKKSGARICLVSNSDENKVFFIAFRTPPTDSTGVPHIIEHTVLCGSEKFPVKDPFIELAKGSLNTFLNAMTYPDKTMYPVASCNDKDFQNLMDVYMDSVLHPNIYKQEFIFKQEGWHYELENPEDDMIINGVVYNEMKGAFSSPDSVLDREILNSLYPDTPYHYESGGDPDVIPELTYEAYLDFHRKYYHPCNSYIYLYGNMDMEEKLRWLDETYLSAYDRIDLNAEIPMQKPFDAPRSVEKYYSISNTESEKGQSYLSCNWAVGTNLDPEQYIAFDLLDYALLSTQGAPIKQALMDAGIGDDIYGGYDSGTLQPVFSVVAKNTDPEREEEFLSIIRSVLEEQVKKGVNKKTLMAAINGSEFKFREADFGRYPKGLMFGLQIMDGWLYDPEHPFIHMDELAIFERLREKIKTDYFEQLIQKYLLDNTHIAKVKILPKKGLNAENEKALQERLNAYRDSLSPEELQHLIDETRALHAYEEEPSTDEQLDTIPLLSRSDMKQASDPHNNHLEQCEQVDYLWHDYETNGVIYMDWIFDAHHIPEEKLPYVSILRYLLGKVDTAHYSYMDLSDEINFYTGGISTDSNVLGILGQENECAVKYEVRMKTLASNLNKAVELAQEIITSSNLRDEKRVYDVLLQTKSRVQSELSDSGHIIAANRALSYYSTRARYIELLHGIDFYRELSRVVDHFEEEKEALFETLEYLVRAIFQKGNLLINCTCREGDYEFVKSYGPHIVDSLFEATERERMEISGTDKKNEGFMDASRIQYVALAGNFAKEGLAYHGAMRVFKTIMSYDYLWNNIRVKGGAYGCGCSFSRSGDVYFSSYRDPKLAETLDVYRGVTDYLESFEADERAMTKYVIGTFSEMDAPLNPNAKGRRSLLAYLSGITYDLIQKDRDEVLAVTPDDIRALAGHLKAVIANSYICAIGNEETLKKQENLFDTLDYLVKK